MAKLSDFLPYVLPYVPGCAEPLALQFVRDTCIDFCVKTRFVINTLDPVSVIEAVSAYDVDPPESGLTIHSIVRAWLNNTPLSIFNEHSATNHAALYNSAVTPRSSTPSALIQTSATSFMLDVAPAQSMPAALTLRAVVKPSRTATTVPDVLLEEYASDIGFGAVARLMRMPAQPFTSADAVSYDALYMSAVFAARLRANKSLGESSISVQQRGFA